MDFSDYSEAVQKHAKELDRITFDLLRNRVIYYIDNEVALLQVKIEHDEWLQIAYLKDKEKIIIIRAEETYPNKLNELILEKTDIDWLHMEMNK